MAEMQLLQEWTMPNEHFDDEGAINFLRQESKRTDKACTRISKQLASLDNKSIWLNEIRKKLT
jgi:hypothetical protein